MIQPTALGVLGGTFDPIHLGHLHLALSIYHGLQLQSIRLVPNAQPTLRTQPPLASPEQRLAMARMAAQNHVGLVIDEQEIIRGGISYTVDTLAAIRAEIGNAPICCILSMDQFCQFHHWKAWREILQLAHLVVTNRPAYRLFLEKEIKQLLQERQVKNVKLLHQAPAGFIFLPWIIPLAISATQIRTLIQQNKDPSIFLPMKVWEYIGAEKLYL